MDSLASAVVLIRCYFIRCHYELDQKQPLSNPPTHTASNPNFVVNVYQVPFMTRNGNNSLHKLRITHSWINKRFLFTSKPIKTD